MVSDPLAGPEGVCVGSVTVLRQARGMQTNRNTGSQPAANLVFMGVGVAKQNTDFPRGFQAFTVYSAVYNYMIYKLLYKIHINFR